MASKLYVGNAPSVAQVDGGTPANVAVGNVFTATINGKTVSFTATVATVAHVTAGLSAACNASTNSEFQEILFADATTLLTATSKSPGRPFTITFSATGGTATLTRSAITASSGPNDVSLAANYSPAGLPATSDDLTVPAGQQLLYGLSGLTNTLGTVHCSGVVGLDPLNASGYAEYRTQYLALTCANLFIDGNPNRVRINLGGTPNVTVLKTANLQNGLEPVQLLGGGIASLTVIAGRVAVAGNAGETATVTSWKTDADSSLSLRCGIGVTFGGGPFVQAGGSVSISSTLGTLNKYGGTLTVSEAAATTAINNYSGPVLWKSSGYWGAYFGGAGTTFDKSDNFSAIANTTVVQLQKAATFNDPWGTITWTAGIKADHCSISDLRLELGMNKTFVAS